MRLGIKGKQIAGVTVIVGVAVIVLSGLFVSRLAGIVLHESYARAQLLGNAIFHRAREVVTGNPEPYAALRDDPGLRSILESSIYGESVTGAAVLDTTGTIVASSDPARIGLRMSDRSDLAALLDRGPVEQLQAIFSGEGQTLEFRQPMTLGDEAFGSIRVGVSTLLMRQELNASLRPALLTAAVALSVAVIVAALLAQLLLRPIHVIRSGLTRLGQGEFGVTLDLPPGDEFGELGQFFNTVSQQISADRTQLAGQTAHLQSAVEHLEDAVALFTQSGDLLFSNRAMQAAMPGAVVGRPIGELLPAGHPFRAIVEETFSVRKPRGPVQARIEPRASNVNTEAGAEPPAQALQLSTYPISGGDGFTGVILVARNLAALSRVQSSIAYSRKLVALGRLTAGIAHEVKNPLNAMMIHLELLRTKIRSAAEVGEPQPAAVGSALGLSTVQRASPAVESALRHVEVIESEVRRLDEVVQGFLKFTRPEELKLQPVALPALFEEILPLIEPEARANKVKVAVDAPASLPDVNGDAGMLRQAFLNLAINACQAMPDGGTLRLAASTGPQRTVEVRVEDTGSGIPPDQLGKIFDLYYTTKEHGTGIGLSMVYRTIQMHDGELEVQSTPGSGTTFRVVLPQAA